MERFKPFLLTLFLAGFTTQPFALAQEPIEDLIHVDGSTISEPVLSDYEYANRTPGFSNITEIIDSEGNPESP